MYRISYSKTTVFGILATIVTFTMVTSHAFGLPLYHDGDDIDYCTFLSTNSQWERMDDFKDCRYSAANGDHEDYPGMVAPYFSTWLGNFYDKKIYYFVEDDFLAEMNFCNPHPEHANENLNEEVLRNLVRNAAEVWNTESAAVSLVYGGALNAENEDQACEQTLNNHSSKKPAIFIQFVEGCKDKDKMYDNNGVDCYKPIENDPCGAEISYETPLASLGIYDNTYEASSCDFLTVLRVYANKVTEVDENNKGDCQATSEPFVFAMDNREDPRVFNSLGDYANLSGLITHEIGHALGMGHPEEQKFYQTCGNVAPFLGAICKHEQEYLGRSASPIDPCDPALAEIRCTRSAMCTSNPIENAQTHLDYWEKDCVDDAVNGKRAMEYAYVSQVGMGSWTMSGVLEPESEATWFTQKAYLSEGSIKAPSPLGDYFPTYFTWTNYFISSCIKGETAVLLDDDLSDGSLAATPVGSPPNSQYLHTERTLHDSPNTVPYLFSPRDLNGNELCEDTNCLQRINYLDAAPRYLNGQYKTFNPPRAHYADSVQQDYWQTTSNEHVSPRYGSSYKIDDSHGIVASHVPLISTWDPVSNNTITAIVDTGYGYYNNGNPLDEHARGRIYLSPGFYQEFGGDRQPDRLVEPVPLVSQVNSPMDSVIPNWPKAPDNYTYTGSTRFAPALRCAGSGEQEIFYNCMLAWDDAGLPHPIINYVFFRVIESSPGNPETRTFEFSPVGVRASYGIASIGHITSAFYNEQFHIVTRFQPDYAGIWTWDGGAQDFVLTQAFFDPNHMLSTPVLLHDVTNNSDERHLVWARPLY